MGIRYFQGVGLRNLLLGFKSFRGVEMFLGGVQILSRGLRNFKGVEIFFGRG